MGNAAPAERIRFLSVILFNISPGSLSVPTQRLNLVSLDAFPQPLSTATSRRIMTLENEFICIWLKYITDKQTQQRAIHHP